MEGTRFLDEFRRSADEHILLSRGDQEKRAQFTARNGAWRSAGVWIQAPYSSYQWFHRENRNRHEARFRLVRGETHRDGLSNPERRARRRISRFRRSVLRSAICHA